MELLLQLMRGESVRGASGEAWNRLPALAQRHHLAASLHRQLKHLPAVAVPAGLRVAMARAAAAAVARNLPRWHLLLSAIPFKGPAIALQAYGDLASRAFNDLDVLVRPRDADQARQTLLALGYRERHTPAGAAGAFLRSHKRGCHLRSAGGEADVDLQWAFTQAYGAAAIDVDALFHTTEWLAGPGGSVPALMPAAHMLVLCVHGAKHRWHRLDWLCDVTELARRRELDWDGLFRGAEALGLRRIVATGLLLADAMLAAPLPAGVIQRAAADPVARRLCMDVCEEFQGGSAVHTDAYTLLRFYGRSRERVRDRLRILWAWTTTPTRHDLEWVKLPPGLTGLYYALRPLRLALAVMTRR